MKNVKNTEGLFLIELGCVGFFGFNRIIEYGGKIL
jgi:hypothetical protein